MQTSVQVNVFQKRIVDAYGALAEACRRLGHEADIAWTKSGLRREPEMSGIVVDGTVVNVRIYPEMTSGSWSFKETGRLRLRYEHLSTPRTRPEAKAGFDYAAVAQEIVEEAAYQAKIRAAAVERKARADANQGVAWAIDEQLGTEECTNDVGRAMGTRNWTGPHLDVDGEGHLAFVLPGPQGRAFLRCTPDEGREVLELALRIARRATGKQGGEGGGR